MMEPLSFQLEMLVVDPSDFAGDCCKLFSPAYRVSVAENVEKALSMVKASMGFEVCISELIVPSYAIARGSAGADEAGAWLIEQMIKSGKCNRVLVLSSRNELPPNLSAFADGPGVILFARKPTTDDQALRRLVCELENTPLPIGLRIPAALAAVWSSYRQMQAAIEGGEIGLTDLSSAIESLVCLSRDLAAPRGLAEYDGHEVFAQIYVDLDLYCNAYNDVYLAGLIREARALVKEVIQKNSLFMSRIS